MKIFCDLDGTLLNVTKRHYQVYSETVVKYSGTPIAQEVYWNLKRKKIKWPELLEKSGIDGGLESNFLTIFIDKIEDPNYLDLDTLFPGAINFLELVSNNHEVYLVSLRRKEGNLLNELERLGIKKYFKQILTGHSETDGYDKKIELIKNVLNDDKGLIIGDTEADIITGKELNMKTVAVCSGIRDKEFLGALSPDYTVDGIEQIKETILG